MSGTGRIHGGAPLHNRNAVKSGVYSFLATGRYPRGASYVGRLVGQLRHALEVIVLERDGQVSVYQAALIQSASRHEGRAQLLQRWLRELGQRPKEDGGSSKATKQESSVQERVAILREIGNATDARDRCLKSLGLHEKPEEDDAWPTIVVRNSSGESGNIQIPEDESSPSNGLALNPCGQASENASAILPGVKPEGPFASEASAKGPE